MEEKEYNFVDKNGNIISDKWISISDYLWDLPERIQRIEDGLWNFVTIDGNLLCPQEWFHDARDFNVDDGTAIVFKKDGTKCVIDKQGEFHDW